MSTDDIFETNFKIFSIFSNRFDVIFGPSYDGIVVHSFSNKVGEYLERMARYNIIQCDEKRMNLERQVDVATPLFYNSYC